MQLSTLHSPMQLDPAIKFIWMLTIKRKSARLVKPGTIKFFIAVPIPHKEKLVQATSFSSFTSALDARGPCHGHPRGKVTQKLVGPVE